MMILICSFPALIFSWEIVPVIRDMGVDMVTVAVVVGKHFPNKFWVSDPNEKAAIPCQKSGGPPVRNKQDDPGHDKDTSCIRRPAHCLLFICGNMDRTRIDYLFPFGIGKTGPDEHDQTGGQ